MGLITGCVGMNVNTLKPMPRGVVVDEETGKPISGAYVLVHYIGDSGIVVTGDPGAIQRDECYGNLVTKTDEVGRFDFSSQGRKKPVSLKFPRNQRMEITAYKPGYTMEVSKGYRDYLDRDLIEVKYEPVGIGAVKLEMTPQEKSKFETRRRYLSRFISDGYCKGYGFENWNMEYAVLEEAGQSTKTLDDWKSAYSICNNINKRNKDEDLGHTVLDCSVYAKKIKIFEDENAERFNEYVEKIKQLVENISWGNLPKFELLRYLELRVNASSNTFSVRSNPEGLYIKDVLKMLKKICDSNYPRNIAEGSVCIYFGDPPGNWKSLTGISCHAHYQAIEYKLKIKKGIGAGSVMDLKPNWCR